MFNVATFDRKIIDTLLNAGVLNDSTHTLLELAEQHGGYIAGGFALQVYQVMIESNSLHENASVLRNSYLQSNLAIRDVTDPNKTPSPGDIDVWFETVEQLTQFVAAYDKLPVSAQSSVYVKKTIGGFATNYFCFDEFGACGQKVQVITGLLGDSEFVCSRFDTLNTMCVLHGCCIEFDERLPEVVKNKEVVINPGPSMMTGIGSIHMRLNRIFEWGTRHKYNFVTSQITALINEKFDDIVVDCAEPVDSASAYGNELISSVVCNVGRFFVKELNDSNLRKLSLYLMSGRLD